MKIKITDKATPFLKELIAKAENKVAVNTVMGKEAEVQLRKHFLSLNTKPNKKSWKKQNFWAQVRSATTLGKIDETSATINISDPRFAMKLKGGTIKPTGGRKYLAIPAIESRYGTSPQSADDRNDLIFMQSKVSNKSYLVRKDNNAIRIQYYLVRSSTQKPQADALPSDDNISNAITNSLIKYFKTKQ